MASWKDNARRTTIGDEVKLESFPGGWVKVKKYSIQGKDEIAEATRAVQKDIDKTMLMSAAKKMKGKTGLTEDQIFDLLSAEEIGAMVDSTSVASSNLFESKIKNGLHSYNFGDGDSKEVKIFAKDILEFEEIALEVIKIIEDFNRPLAPKTSSISEMSQNGSTTEQNLTTETKLTEENPPS